MSTRNEFDAMKKGMEGLAANGYLGTKKTDNDDLSAYEEFVPPSNIHFNVSNDENFEYNNKPQQATQLSAPPSQFRDGQFSYELSVPEPIDAYDERLFPGGPNKSEVESWKKQYDALYIVDDLPGDKVFIYRTINRYEYKAIMATPNTDPLMREEMICEQCVLFPYEYSYGQMANGDAGVVTVIAQHVMETSGFTKASLPRRL